jgi:hypothetical protein
MPSSDTKLLTHPERVFQLKVGQYRRLGYEVVEVDELARRAKVCVPIARATSVGIPGASAQGRHAIYRLIEVDATGRVRDQRVYS